MLLIIQRNIAFSITTHHLNTGLLNGAPATLFSIRNFHFFLVVWA